MTGLDAIPEKSASLVCQTFEYAERAIGNLSLDLYTTQEKAKALVVLGYGGGFAKGSRSDAIHLPLVNRLHAAGFAVAVPDYRLKTKPGEINPKDMQQVHRLAKRAKREGTQMRPKLFGPGLFAACEDISDAIRFCRRKPVLTVANKSIFMLGISAGGLIGNTLCYPPGVWAKQFEQPDAMVALAAPCIYTWRLARDGPPIWIIHGKRDRIIPVADSLTTAQKAKVAQSPVKVSILEKAPHVGIERYLASKLVNDRQTYLDQVMGFFDTSIAHSSE